MCWGAVLAARPGVKAARCRRAEAALQICCCWNSEGALRHRHQKLDRDGHEEGIAIPSRGEVGGTELNHYNILASVTNRDALELAGAHLFHRLTPVAVCKVLAQRGARSKNKIGLSRGGEGGVPRRLFLNAERHRPLGLPLLAKAMAK